jgi:hypothetical protein
LAWLAPYNLLGEETMHALLRYSGLGNRSPRWMTNTGEAGGEPARWLASFRGLEWLDPQVPCLLLARQGQGLLLLIEGIHFRAEGLRGALAFLALEEEELELRTLAIRAVRTHGPVRGDVPSHLSRDLELAVRPDAEGICVDWAAIDSWVKGAHESPAYGEVAPADRSRPALARDSHERRWDLALTLRDEALPAGDGPLIVIAGSVEARALREAGVWRGLTSLVPSEEWTRSGEVPKPWWRRWF